MLNFICMYVKSIILEYNIGVIILLLIFKISKVFIDYSSSLHYTNCFIDLLTFMFLIYI